MSMPRLIVIFICWLLAATCCFGAPAVKRTPGSPRVIIFGNRSMQSDAFIHLTGLDEAPGMSADEIRKRLQTTSLYSSVAVYRQQNVVTIYVHEKTNWFVVPYFSADSNAKIFGTAFGKATLYGRDARLLGRYQFGTGDHEASLLFNDTGIFNSRLMLGGSLDYESALHWIFDGPTGRVVTQRTLNDLKGGSFQTGYNLTPYWFLGLNNYIEEHRFELPTGPVESGLQWSHKLYIDYDHLYVNEGLSDGFEGRTYFESTNPVSDFDFRKVGVFATGSPFRHGNLNWIIRGKSEYGIGLPYYQLFELGGGKLRGYPNEQFRGRIYGVVQNDLLLTSANVWILRLRPLLWTDWGYVQGGGRTGVGTGFQVYVRDVAIPAVQLFVGYGFHPDGYAIAASIGPQI